MRPVFPQFRKLGVNHWRSSGWRCSGGLHWGYGITAEEAKQNWLKEINTEQQDKHTTKEQKFTFTYMTGGYLYYQGWRTMDVVN